MIDELIARIERIQALRLSDEHTDQLIHLAILEVAPAVRIATPSRVAPYHPPDAPRATQTNGIGSTTPDTAIAAEPATVASVDAAPATAVAPDIIGIVDTAPGVWGVILNGESVEPLPFSDPAPDWIMTGSTPPPDDRPAPATVRIVHHLRTHDDWFTAHEIAQALELKTSTVASALYHLEAKEDPAVVRSSIPYNPDRHHRGARPTTESIVWRASGH